MSGTQKDSPQLFLFNAQLLQQIVQDDRLQTAAEGQHRLADEGSEEDRPRDLPDSKAVQTIHLLHLGRTSLNKNYLLKSDEII